MKTPRSQANRPAESGCPKRLWVMLTLTDDESLGADGVLPRGLSFHLSQCPSCQVLSQQLAGVGEGLVLLGKSEATSRLESVADSRVRAALANGAKLTNRVDIGEDEFDDIPLRPRFARWRIPSAIAAAIILFAVWVGFSILGRTTQPSFSERWQPVTRIDRNRASSPDAGDSHEDFTASAVTDGRGVGFRSDFMGPPAPLSVCRNQTRYEAATSDDVSCVPVAFPVANPARRDVEMAPGIDNSATVGSTPR